MTTSALIGLDLGGTLLKSAVLTVDGRVLDRASTPSGASHGATGAIEGAIALCAELSARLEVTPLAVGIGIPGAVDPVSGRLAGPTPHVPGAETLALRDHMAAALGVPVSVANDATCAARAEAALGAAMDVPSALVVTLGTGVGSGLVIDGRVVLGSHGGAGEIGHWPIGSGEVSCRCGVPNCAEPEMSAGGLVRLCEARGLPWRDPAELLAAAAGGDARAAELVVRMADRLGATLAIAAQVIDCDLVVLGGGLVQSPEYPLEALRAAANGYLQGWRKPTGLPILLAKLGTHAGAIGAALMAGELATR